MRPLLCGLSEVIRRREAEEKKKQNTILFSNIALLNTDGAADRRRWAEGTRASSP